MGAVGLGKEEMPIPMAAPWAQGRVSQVPWGPYRAQFVLSARSPPEPPSHLPGRCPVMLRAVQQCPHVCLVPPGDVDHQHPCKAREKGQMGPGVIP